MLWLIMTTPSPRSRSRSMRSSTSAVCATPSAAVGSSSTITRGFPSSERAIATVWRWPPDSEATGIRTVGIRADSSPSSSQARVSICTSSSRHGVSSRPRKRFCTTFRFSHSARSWNTVAIPRCIAALGSAMSTGSELKEMLPRSGRCTPARTFTRVDFPAPLSPTMAITSPCTTSRSMSVRAFTAPKVLEIPRKLSTVLPVSGRVTAVVDMKILASECGPVRGWASRGVLRARPGKQLLRR